MTRLVRISHHRVTNASWTWNK